MTTQTISPVVQEVRLWAAIASADEKRGDEVVKRLNDLACNDPTKRDYALATIENLNILAAHMNRVCFLDMPTLEVAKWQHAELEAAEAFLAA